MTQSELQNGQDFHFDNSQWCEENNSDDFREGWITWNDRFNNFAIHFNGVCVHTSRTFQSSMGRLERLMLKWNCEFVDVEDFV